MKPKIVEIGQAWTYEGMQGRPLFVIAIENRPGCTPDEFQAIVPWAVFRKGKRQPVHDMLKNPSWSCINCTKGDI